MSKTVEKNNEKKIYFKLPQHHSFLNIHNNNKQ